MVVHGVVYRESKVIEQKILPEIKNFVKFENETTSQGQEKESSGAQASADEKMSNPEMTKNAESLSSANDQSKDNLNKNSANNSQQNTSTMLRRRSFVNKKKHQDHHLSIEQPSKASLLDKFSFELKSKLDGCEIRAKLLESPCLKAAYMINNVECNALITNEMSKINCSLHSHCLSFECDDDFLTKSPTAEKPRAAAANVQESESAILLQQDGMMTMKSLEERTSFFLPSISLTGNHVARTIQNVLEKPNEDPELRSVVVKSANVIDVKFKARIASISRELNAQVIAQLVFVTKVFIKEMNYILMAVYGLDDGGFAKAAAPIVDENQKSSLNQAGFMSRFYYHVSIELGKISLTGITPSNTALTVYTGEKSVLLLTNENSNETDVDEKAKYKRLINESIYTVKPMIEAKCNISVELKTALNKSNKFKSFDEGLKAKASSSQADELSGKWIIHFCCRLEY